jgi:hypothetical protein
MVKVLTDDQKAQLRKLITGEDDPKDKKKDGKDKDKDKDKDKN